jgi:hypothetical protein
MYGGGPRPGSITFGLLELPPERRLDTDSGTGGVGHAGVHEPGAGGGPVGAARPTQRRAQPGDDVALPANGPGAVCGERAPAATGTRPADPPCPGIDLPSGRWPINRRIAIHHPRIWRGAWRSGPLSHQTEQQEQGALPANLFQFIRTVCSERSSLILALVACGASADTLEERLCSAGIAGRPRRNEHPRRRGHFSAGGRGHNGTARSAQSSSAGGMSSP